MVSEDDNNITRDKYNQIRQIYQIRIVYNIIKKSLFVWIITLEITFQTENKMIKTLLVQELLFHTTP